MSSGAQNTNMQNRNIKKKRTEFSSRTALIGAFETKRKMASGNLEGTKSSTNDYAVELIKCLIIKPTRFTNFSKLFLE